MKQNINVRTRLPEGKLPENMRIENQGQLRVFLMNRLKATSGEYRTIEQVREHFNGRRVRAIA